MRHRLMCAALAGFVAVGLASGLTAQPASAETDGGAIVSVTNWRLFATTSTTPLYSGQTKTLQVTGYGGVPYSGVSAVVVDVAASSAKSVYVALAPTGSGPAYSQLSVRENAGWDSNTAIVPVSSTGKIDLAVSGGATQVVLDIQGYVTSDASTENGGFVAIPQARIARSDTGQGFPSTAVLGGGGNHVVDVAGRGGVPSDATAVFANVRVFAATGPGALRVGPSSTWLNATSISTLNYQATAVYDSAALIRLGADGRIRLFGDSGTSFHVMIDVQGYVTPGDDGAGFTPMASQYILNQAQLLGGETREVQVTGVAGIPDVDEVGAAMFTFIATSWTSSAGLSLYNADDPESNVWQLGLNGTSTNTPQRTTVVARVSTAGTVKITNHGTSPVGVQIAVQGWFSRDLNAPPTDLSAQVSGPSVTLSARPIGDTSSALRVRFIVFDSDGNEVSNGFSDAVPSGSTATRALQSLANGHYSVEAWGIDGDSQSLGAAKTSFVIDYQNQDPPEDPASAPIEPGDPQTYDPELEGFEKIFDEAIQSEATEEEEALFEAAIDEGAEELPAEIAELAPGPGLQAEPDAGATHATASTSIRYSPQDCVPFADNPHISTKYPTRGWTKAYARTVCEDKAERLAIFAQLYRDRWWGWEAKGGQRGGPNRYNVKLFGVSGAWNGCNNKFKGWILVSDHYQVQDGVIYSGQRVNWNRVKSCLT